MTPAPSTFTAAAPPQSPCTAPAAPLPARSEAAWHDLAEWVKAEAVKIQAALLPVVERWESQLLARGELVEIARANWRRAFCISDTKRPSARHMHRLLQRVIERDGGRREWTRRELYVRENPPRRPDSRVELSGADEPLAEVFGVLLSFAVPARPTDNEMECLWRTARRWFQSTIEEGTRPKNAKAQLNTFLLKHAAWLATSRNNMDMAVRRAFQKLAHGKNAGDGRRAKRGVKRKPPIPQEDAIKIAAYVTFATGGRLAQGQRELVEMRGASGISEATLDLMDTGGRKDYVNRRLADTVQPLTRAAAPHVLGKKAVDDATPSLTRDYSRLRSMMVVTADDWTPEVYSTVENEAGWFDLKRGQVLIFADVASHKIITHVDLPREQYTARDVRSCMNVVCLDQGRPDQWDFERALWKEAHLVKGTTPRGWRVASVSPEDTAGAWEKLGVRFNHARRARSKPAELVIGMLQKFMERCPGYCGHREMDDCPQETKLAKLEFATARFKAAVLAGTERIDKYFFTRAQWVEQLGRLIDAYNNDPQGGRLNGLSPNQAFEKFWPHDNPPVKFDPSCWHLCANYVRQCEVKDVGITFDFGRERFSYFDEALSPYRHRSVLAWFDPARPEILGITDLDQRNPFFVQRSNPVDYLATLNPDSAEAEHYRAEVAKQAGFNKHARGVFRSVKSEFKRTFRPNLVEQRTAALGKEMLTKRIEAQAVASAKDKRQNRIIRKARELGVPVATLTDFSEDTERSLDRRLKRRSKLTSE